MKNKKIIVLISGLLLLLIIGVVSGYLLNKQAKAPVEKDKNKKEKTQEDEEIIHKDGVFSYLEKNADGTYTLVLSSTSSKEHEEDHSIRFTQNDYSMGVYNAELGIYVAGGPLWYVESEDIKVTKVLIKNKIYPTKTFYWFNNYSDLKEIVGLENIDFSNVNNTSGMFSGCSGLTSLDLSTFDMKNVTTTALMFAGCSSLKTIYVNEKLWNLASVEYGNSMFYNNISLVGSKGTKFDNTHIDKEYARIDKQSTPGYLTKK